jgi:hypothetical protein
MLALTILLFALFAELIGWIGQNNLLDFVSIHFFFKSTIALALALALTYHTHYSSIPYISGSLVHLFTSRIELSRRKFSRLRMN